MLLLFFIYQPTLAEELEWLDHSIDEQIKNEYNTDPTKNGLLPNLPKSYYEQNIDGELPIFEINPTDKKTENKPIQKATTSPKKVEKVLNGCALKIKSGTKFEVKNKTAFSSSSPKGAVVTFESVYAQQFKNTTLPAGTKFKAIITDAHRPQITGNGGLIELRISEIFVDGRYHPINGKITMANEKKIFFNSIKGERRYFKNLGKTTKPTGRFMAKMWKKTCQYYDKVPEGILAPITFTAGVVAVTGGTAISPIVSFFSKGKGIYFNANTSFTIKILDDALIL